MQMVWHHICIAFIWEVHSVITLHADAMAIDVASSGVVHHTVGQRKKVTAVTFFPARLRLDQRAQIRAKYPKFPLMNSRDVWRIEWM